MVTITYVISVLLEQTRLSLLAGRARARSRVTTEVVTDLSKTLLSYSSVSFTVLRIVVVTLQMQQ